MQEHGYCRKCEIPAFGNWDCYDGLPFTQCFDVASRQQQPTAAAGHIRYGYSHDRDLYVAGDLYANDVVTPAVIVVPRRRLTSDQAEEDDDVGVVKGSEAKGKKLDGKWVGDFEEPPPSPLPAAAAFVTRPTPKPVDEDLYKIPPELLLHVKPRKKRGLSFFSCCLLPTCAM